MKKYLLLYIVIILVILCTGCGNGILINESSSDLSNDSHASEQSEVSKTEKDFDEKLVLKQIDKKEYIYQDTMLDNRAVLLLKNNSAFNLTVTVNATFYKGNEIVEVEKQSAYDFDSNLQIAFLFYNGRFFDSIVYEYQIEEYKFPKAISLVSLESEKATGYDNIINVYATNNGMKAVKDVKYYALFFNNNKLVDCAWDYCGDSDHEIKPAEIVKTVTYSSAWRPDTAEVYLANQ